MASSSSSSSTKRRVSYDTGGALEEQENEGENSIFQQSKRFKADYGSHNEGSHDTEGIQSSSTSVNGGASSSSSSTGAVAPVLSATEAQVGIECLLTREPGIGGNLKQRYSDFLVHEINLQHDIVKLKSVLPQYKKQQKEQRRQSTQTETETTGGDPVTASTGEESKTRGKSLLEQGWKYSTELLSHGDYLTGSNKFRASNNLYPIVGTPGVRQILALVQRIRNDVVTIGSGAVVSSWKKGKTASSSTSTGEGNDSVHDSYDTVLPLTTQSKVDRTTIHQTIRQYLPFLESVTVNEKGSQKTQRQSQTGGIRVLLSKTLNKKQLEHHLGFRRQESEPVRTTKPASETDRTQRRNWNQLAMTNDIVDYYHFTLYKVNIDTMSAISRISNLLRIRPGLFGYAGTKDKRAVTTQEVSVSNVDPQKLAGVNHAIANIRLGDFEEASRPLKLGELRGNMFEIVLRNVQWQPHSLSESKQGPSVLSEWGKHNFRFVNYFGLQRFGSQEIPTHYIGRALLAGRFKEAIVLILRFDLWENEVAETFRQKHPELSQSVLDVLQDCLNSESHQRARKKFMEKRSAKALFKMLPHFSPAEHTLLEGLSTYGLEKPIEAIKAIARPTKLFYLHSYQSYLWNKLASYRIQRLGEQVVVGDMVLSGSSPTVEDMDYEDSTNSKIPEPHWVSQEDIDNQSYSVEDIVLPIPGESIQFPKNEVDGTVVDELLKADDLTPLGSSSPVDNLLWGAGAPIKSLNMGRLSGQYRHAFVNATDVEWEMMPYNDPKVPLFDSDLDLLAKNGAFIGGGKGNQYLRATEELIKCQKEEEEYRKQALSEETFSSLSDSITWACKLKLSLPSGCYATMALREVMKSSTRKSDMAGLNQNEKL